MKIVLILCLFFSFSNTVICQTPTYTGVDPCSGLLYVSSDINKEYSANEISEFYLQYIAINFEESQDFLIEDMSGEVPLKCSNEGLDRVEFGGRIKRKPFFITIDLKRRILETDPEEINSDEYLFFENVIEDRLGYPFLGSFKRASEVQIISIVKVTLKYRRKEFVFKDSIKLQRLINPQILASEGSFIRPFRAYYFKKRNSIALYFNGQILNKNVTDVTGLDAHESYLAKLIIDLCGKSEPKLNVIPGAYLGVYGWLDCKEGFNLFDFY